MDLINKTLSKGNKNHIINTTNLFQITPWQFYKNKPKNRFSILLRWRNFRHWWNNFHNKNFKNLYHLMRYYVCETVIRRPLMIWKKLSERDSWNKLTIESSMRRFKRSTEHQLKMLKVAEQIKAWRKTLETGQLMILTIVLIEILEWRKIVILIMMETKSK